MLEDRGGVGGGGGAWLTSPTTSLGSWVRAVALSAFSRLAKASLVGAKMVPVLKVGRALARPAYCRRGWGREQGYSQRAGGTKGHYATGSENCCSTLHICALQAAGSLTEAGLAHHACGALTHKCAPRAMQDIPTPAARAKHLRPNGLPGLHKGDSRAGWAPAAAPEFCAWLC